MRTVDRLPRGYAYVNDVQLAEWINDGTINGASSIVDVRGEPTSWVLNGLAVRLRRPKSWDEIQSLLPRLHATMFDADPSIRLDWYVREYENGWKAAGRGGSFDGNPAWEDGYLDRKFERAKWHLTHCTNHDECGEN